MILFLNFAPLAFMGGAEKWMNDIAKEAKKYEDAVVVSVSPQIANIYGQLVLKRKFDTRASSKDLVTNISLSVASFIPLSHDWKKARKLMKDARVIYLKFELLETFILFYFAGLSGFKKAAAGIHSPFIYASPEGFFDNLHNTIYSSGVIRSILAHFRRVHVLNKRDLKFMSERFHLSQVVYVPNSLPEVKSPMMKQNTALQALFVGELSQRKGVDILLEIIDKAPKNIFFTIAGDGPLQEEVRSFIKDRSNCDYKGYVSHSEMSKLYQKSDVLLLPSRAESMSLAVLESLSYGLVILNSPQTSLALGKDIEYSSESVDGYLRALEKISADKNRVKTKEKIRDFFNKNFSTRVVYPQLFSQVLEVQV